MARNLTLNLSVEVPGGAITVDLTGVDLDHPGVHDAALDMVRRLLEVQAPAIAAAIEDQGTEHVDAPSPKSVKKSARKAARRASGKPGVKRQGTAATAILTYLASLPDRTHHGSAASLAEQVEGAGSTPGARSVAVGALCKTDRVEVTRDGSRITSIRITEAGRRLLDGQAPASKPAPKPEPVKRVSGLPTAVDDPDDGDDLAWATEALAAP